MSERERVLIVPYFRPGNRKKSCHIKKYKTYFHLPELHSMHADTHTHPTRHTHAEFLRASLYFVPFHGSHLE